MKLMKWSLLPGLMLAGCFEIAPPDPPPIGAAIEGQLLVQGAFSANDVTARTRHAIGRLKAGGQVNAADLGPDQPRIEPTGRIFQPRDYKKYELDWVPGELMVTTAYRQAVPREVERALNRELARAGLAAVAEVVSCMASTLCRVTLELDGKRLEKAPTFELAERLNAARPEGLNVVAINSIKHAMRVPNDEHFDLQWSFGFARMPGAWDITTGSNNVVVAVIDGGLNLSHPDILGRTVPGFDFVSNAQQSGDGDGVDPDPTDPGDNAFGNGQHSWHGTHVTGLIGAATNNTQGVSGVMWEGRILPVRALGLGQTGSDIDILNAILWSVGETDLGDDPLITVNANPAKVVNISLGGPSSAEVQQVWEDIIAIVTVTDAARFNSPILVTAAGNEGQNASLITPANIPGLITVGATKVDGTRAAYSNFGPDIDIMAPGGQLNLDQDADGFGDGVLSLFDNTYEFEQGTSFATPHVTGVVGLMVSIDPTINQARAQELIRLSGDAAGTCTEGCGTGHLDATRALLQAGGVIADRPQIAVDASRLIYQPTETQLQIRVLNLGAAPLDWQATITGRQELWTVTPAGGNIPSAGESTVLVTLNRGNEGTARAALLFEGLGEAADQAVVVDLSFNDIVAPPQANLNIAEVTAFAVDELGNLTEAAKTETRRDAGFNFRIEGLDPGSYIVVAVGDDDNDGDFNPATDSFGAWQIASDPQPIVIEANVGLVRGVNFGLQRGSAIGDGAVGANCINALDCGFAPDAECINDFPGGYCSRECDDGFCGLGATCELLDCEGTPCNVCLEKCVDAAQCRDGYVCDPFGTCTPDGF